MVYSRALKACLAIGTFVSLLAIVGWATLPRSSASNMEDLQNHARLLSHLLGWAPPLRDGKHGKHWPARPRQSNGTVTEVQGFVTPEVFKEKYLWKEPVVFRNAATNANGFDLGCLTGKKQPANEVLADELGNKKFRVFVDEFNDTSAEFMTIAEYELLAKKAMEDKSRPRPYARAFAQDLLNECRPVPSAKLKQYRSKSALTSMPGESALLFYSVLKNTRSRMHIDAGDSFFTQIQGRKRWLFADPQYASSLELYAHDLNLAFFPGYDVHGEPVPNDVHLKEVVLHPGDVLYFPSMTFHAVYNMDPMTIGVDEVAMDPLGSLRRHWLLTVASQLNPFLFYNVFKQVWKTGTLDGHALYFNGFSDDADDQATKVAAA